MSIRFKCPNGHEMNVKDKYAGQTGLCPTCQARVLVPSASARLSDDAILDLLGPPPVDDIDEMPVHQMANQHADPANVSGISLLGASQLNRGMKQCPKCKRDVREVYDICPHCRTYFTDNTEVSRRMKAMCKQCGAEYEHHLVIIWCKQCGADMRQQ